jgi:hypothetical protein
VSLHELFARYHQQIQFLMIYIREAHPIDGWWLGKGLLGWLLRLRGTRAATDVYDPKTIGERRAVAGRCDESLKYGIRTYVDEMDDRVNKAYAAHPTRLYLVGMDGRVAYAGGAGPFGFRPADLASAIEKLLQSG